MATRALIVISSGWTVATGLRTKSAGTTSAFLNRTVIAVNDDAVTVRHGPIPWPANVRVAVPAITQLYFTTRRNRFAFTPWNQIVFDVHALLEDGGRMTLIANLPSSSHAQSIQDLIEAALAVQHKPVDGEYQGDRRGIFGRDDAYHGS